MGDGIRTRSQRLNTDGLSPDSNTNDNEDENNNESLEQNEPIQAVRQKRKRTSTSQITSQNQPRVITRSQNAISRNQNNKKKKRQAGRSKQTQKNDDTDENQTPGNNKENRSTGNNQKTNDVNNNFTVNVPELISIISNLTSNVPLWNDRQAASTTISVQGPKLETIPLFDPEERKYTIEQWIYILEDLQEINNWPEKTLTSYMIARLHNTARLWYDSLYTYPRTWEAWKEALRSTFSETDGNPTDIEKMRNRMKMRDESYERYYFEKLLLLQPCGLQERQQVNYIIDGLTPADVRRAMHRGSFEKPADLFQELKKEDAGFTRKDPKLCQLLLRKKIEKSKIKRHNSAK